VPRPSGRASAKSIARSKDRGTRPIIWLRPTAALTLKRHLDNILTYFHHPITNGVAEGLNSKIMSIKRKARGHRNKENFKTAIYFFCGGLDLDPQ